MVVYVTMQRLRGACAYTQSRMSLHFSYAISMAVDEDAENIRPEKKNSNKIHDTFHG